MNRFLIIAGLAAVLVPGVSDAADEQKEHFVIALRLPEWTSMHFDDPATAQQHAAAVKKLGAEVRVEQHNGHTDVSYRTSGWKALRVETDELAHTWEDWLKRAGFETLHGHNPDHAEHAHHTDHDHEHANEHAEVVLVRTPDWVSQHVQDRDTASDLVVIAEALRCEVQQGEHADHVDVRFRCPEWTAVEFPSHEAATSWMKWLKSSGFEVRHEHGATDSHAGHNH
ncbi:hypothetical protein NG895_02300 [Aeoliella sp. ICT_H6.2]|uniref:Secreted protein n=1 Tax=Aeoliella straminimaris TaxID=2954799 RepID=A0A9X2F6X3_9BACT|nr:hypothetical protein [Aeoliella straminimaris]MCO6042728.1 hypothetical protein [Aeoliella straminimaris]